MKTIAGFLIGSLLTAILLITYASYDTLRKMEYA